MVERRGAQSDEHLARPRARDRARPRSAGPRARRPRGSDRLHPGAQCPVTTAELRRLAEELGSTRWGRARRAYEETERHIRERRARGLFADMRFTMAQPEVSCHPETLLAGRADGRLRRALLLRARPHRRAGRGAAAALHLERPYAELREKLDALGRALGGDVPRARRREPARRPRGRRTRGGRLLRQEHDADHAPPRSWVVLGTLVTDVEIEPSRRSSGLRRVHALHRRVPDRRARRARRARRHALPLVLDAGARADPGGLPRGARRQGLRLRHLPGRLPVEPRGREAPRADEPADGEADVSLVDWL